MIDEKEVERYKKRKSDSEGKQLDNASLRAGSAMYYYCRHCGVNTDCRAESDFSGGPICRICDGCKRLENSGYFNQRA